MPGMSHKVDLCLCLSVSLSLFLGRDNANMSDLVRVSHMRATVAQVQGSVRP